MSPEALLAALLLETLKQAGAYAQLLNASRLRGTPITQDELNALAANDDAVRAALEGEIARQLAAQ
jgi:hypothetical protein